MWSKNKGRADVQRFIGQTSLTADSAELVGGMNLKGAVQIDGTVRGTLQAHEGLVRVSTGGRVDGETRTPHVIVDGQMDDDIHAVERLELGAQARVRGNLHYGLIGTTMGVQIEDCLYPMTEASPRPLELPASVETVDQLTTFLGQEDNGHNVVTHGLRPGDSET